MKNQLLRTLLPVFGGLLFALLFAHEKWGVNTVLFTLFLLGTLAYDKPFRHWSMEGRVTALTSLLLAGLVVLNNTGFAKFCLSGCLLVTI